MMINFYITKNSEEYSDMFVDWDHYRFEGDSIGKYSKSNDKISIVYDRSYLESTPREGHGRIYGHFCAPNIDNSDDVPFNLRDEFIIVIQDVINKILTLGNDCQEGDKDYTEQINIIIHWGALGLSTSREATFKLETEVEKYCEKNSCDTQYHFYHYTTNMGEVGINKLKDSLNFEDQLKGSILDPHGNPVLEAKLNLLHECLTPLGLDGLVLPDILSKYHCQYENFIKEAKSIQEPFSPEYIRSLSELRDALLNNEQLD